MAGSSGGAGAAGRALWGRGAQALRRPATLAWLVPLLALVAGPAYLHKSTQMLLIQVFTLAVFGVSYDLLMGYSGITSFGHAMFFGLGAYLLGILLKLAHLPLWLIVPAIVVAASVLAVLVGTVSLRIKGVHFAMVTLAFAELLFILSMATELRPWTGGDEGLHDFPILPGLHPWLNRTHFYYLGLGFLIGAYLVARRFVSSPTGRVLQAIRENEERAVAIGYHTFLYKVAVTILAGVLAALAGAFNALFFRNATPEVLGVGRTIDALLVTIIGGVGTLVGPILGAGVVRLVGHYLVEIFGPRWPFVFGVVYILLVMFFPYGLIGTWQVNAPRLRRWLGRRVVRET